MLDNLLQNNTLLSWNIRGYDSYTQVSLRFSDELPVGDMSYRKSPPSRIKRDNERKVTWEAKTGHTTDESDGIDESKPKDSNNSIAISQGTSGTDMVSPCTEVDINNTILPDTKPLKNVGKSQSVGNIATSTDLDSFIKTINTPAVKPADAAGSTSSPHQGGMHVDHNIVIGDTVCDLCKKSISTKQWFRCTTCGDFDVCQLCNKRGHHSEHTSQLHRFNNPDGHHIYCESCGISFEDMGMYIFFCKTCEDYPLCCPCRMKGMHSIHAKQLKLVTVETYKNKVG